MSTYKYPSERAKETPCEQVRRQIREFDDCGMTSEEQDRRAGGPRPEPQK